MSKYAIVCTAINTDQLPFTGAGTVNGVEFECATIIYGGRAIWKVKEHGMLPAPTEMSQFTRGERSAIAAWMKKVEQNPELVDKNSQLATATGLAPKRTATARPSAEVDSLKSELAELKAMMRMLMGQDSEVDADEDSEE
jgi:hypothetical protein